RGIIDGATTVQLCLTSESADTSHSLSALPRNKNAPRHSDRSACAPTWRPHRGRCRTRQDSGSPPAVRPRPRPPHSAPWQYRYRQTPPHFSSWLVPYALRLGPVHPGNPRSTPHTWDEPPQALSGHAVLLFLLDLVDAPQPLFPDTLQ